MGEIKKGMTLQGDVLLSVVLFVPKFLEVLQVPLGLLCVFRRRNIGSIE